jgi:hypothetical protein
LEVANPQDALSTDETAAIDTPATEELSFIFAAVKYGIYAPIPHKEISFRL